jgi:hypothetical protein
MRRILHILASLAILAAAPKAAAQPDQARLAALDSMVVRYVGAIRSADMDTKASEADFMIGSCTDSLVRQRVALKLYSLYVDSPLMGEEAVAIHIYDTWFATGRVAMASELDLMNARIFADFNRSTLLGMDAPPLLLRRPDGSCESLPLPGHSCILYFYDTGCSSCTAQTILLPYVLEKVDFKTDLYAIYTGTDEKLWTSYTSEHFKIDNPLVTVHHLWDPEIESDYQRLYGVLSTPRMYLVEPQGTLIGRRLDVESLGRLMVYAGALQNLYDKHLK